MLRQTLAVSAQAAPPPWLPSWTTVWLLAGGLLLVLAAATLGYVLAHRRWDRLRDVLHHPLLVRADRALARRLPGPWRFIRQRFSVHGWHGLALTVATVVTFVALYLFVLIVESWTDREALYAFDQHVSAWVRASLGPEAIGFMAHATRLGDGAVLVALGTVVGAVLLYRRHAHHVLTLLLAPGAGSAIVVGLKALFERSRPDTALAASLGHSFPSGHAFSAMTFYGFLLYLAWRRAPSTAVRFGATAVLVGIILLVGLSRVALNVHWTSDVAGGFALGLAWLTCSLVLTRTLRALWHGTRRASSDTDALTMTPLKSLLLIAPLLFTTACAPDGPPDGPSDGPPGSNSPEAPPARAAEGASVTGAYDLGTPDLSLALPRELFEISGLTLLADGRIGAVQDEQGLLFVLNPSTGAIDERTPFGDDGDYEGVERVGDRLFVLRADGALLELTGEAGSARPLATGLDDDCDAEGLAYDPAGDHLLIACKEDPGAGLGDVRAVYAYDLAAGTLSDAPVLTIDPDAVDDRIDAKGSFKPSALAVHPTSGDVYVLSATQKALAVVHAGGGLGDVWTLPDELFEQPEGLAFGPDEALYVASEGDDGPAMLYRFPVRR